MSSFVSKESKAPLLAALIVGIVAMSLCPQLDKWLVAAVTLPLVAVVACGSLLFSRTTIREGFLLTAFTLLGLWLFASQSLTGYSALHKITFPSECAAILSHRIDILFSQAPLIKAVLLGDKSALEPQTINAFRLSGASHILALSGLHLGIIYLVVSYSLYFFRSRVAGVVRCVLILLFCTFYAVVTGLSASISRALIFIIIREVSILRSGQSLGDGKRLLDTLCTAALIQLCFLGVDNLFSVGFQLSYLAILGIALFSEPLQNCFPMPSKTVEIEGYEATRASKFLYYPTRFLKYIWDIAALSISCQITTAPLVYYYFGNLTWNFLLTNILAIPLSTVSIVCALLGLVTGLPLLCNIADFFAQTLITIITIIAG